MVGVESFTTPSGRTVRLRCRPGTCDQSNSAHVVANDEYHLDVLLGAVLPGGVVVDVGAYIGAFAITAALLLRTTLVVAMEPIPENADLIAENAELNGVSLVIDRRAASKEATVEIEYGYADRYAFVGNMGENMPWQHITVPGASLSDLVDEYGDIGLLKIDCEGCEYEFLDDPAIARVHRLLGEVHGDRDPVYDRVLETHEVHFSDYHFFAVRR